MNTFIVFGFFIFVFFGLANAQVNFLEPTDYMVAIFKNNQPVCAGTLLKVDTVVTAAHCVYRATGLTVGRTKNPNQEPSAVRNIFVHPYYRPPSVNYDVAVLKIANINQNMFLNLQDAELPGGQALIRSGWVAENDNFAAAAATLVDKTSCKNSLGSYLGLTSKMICCNIEGNNVPFIDGSPVVLRRQPNQEFLAGIASFMVQNATQALPKVYTNVVHSEIKSFIQIYL